MSGTDLRPVWVMDCKLVLQRLRVVQLAPLLTALGCAGGGCSGLPAMGEWAAQLTCTWLLEMGVVGCLLQHNPTQRSL